MTKLTAACYCQAITLNADEQPTSIVNCHCGQCRRLSGAAYTTWVSIPKDGLRGTENSSLTSYQVTPNATRHFCKTCGTHVFTLDRRYPDIAAIPAGVIQTSIPLQPTAHYFVDHKADWHLIDDALPQFGGESGFERRAN